MRQKTWSPLAYSLVQGHGCRKCAYDLAVTNRVGVTAKKTHDMFIEELRKKNLLYAKSQFHLLGSYTGSKGKKYPVNAMFAIMNGIPLRRPF